MRGIFTDDDCQIIFEDTSDIHKNNNKLVEYIFLNQKSINDIDLLIYIKDMNINFKGNDFEHITKDIKMISNIKQDKILVYKIDVLDEESLTEKIENIKII